MNNRPIHGFMIAVCLVCMACGDSFAMMKPLSTAQLVAESDAVVVGSVTHVKSFFTKDRKFIITRASIEVREVVSGHLVSSNLVVEYKGGEVGGLGCRVSDVASLTQGEDVLLFVKSAVQDGNELLNDTSDVNARALAEAGHVYEMVGLAQGKYAIRDSKVTKGGFSVAGADANVDREMTLADMLAKIRKLASEK